MIFLLTNFGSFFNQKRLGKFGKVFFFSSVNLTNFLIFERKKKIANLTSPGPSKARSNSNLRLTSKTLKIRTVND
jgi:hypothetical protein